eukprot:PhF_6_TR26668/c0_g1_i3/m.38739/K15909/SHIP2, INPPL1; phosphatidylinositol-3,4,5-trisphosphate 5-phosphatase 2
MSNIEIAEMDMAKTKKESLRQSTTTEWWRAKAESLGARHLVSPHDERIYQGKSAKSGNNKSKKTQPETKPSNTAPDSPTNGRSDDATETKVGVPGDIVLYIDRVEFVPSQRQAEHHTLRMAYTSICAVRRQVDDGISIILSTGHKYLMSFRFVRVFRSQIVDVLLQYFTNVFADGLTESTPVITPQSVSRVAFPDHTYWAQNADEYVVGVLSKQKCVITNQRLMLQLINTDYEYEFVANMYIKDPEHGGLIIMFGTEEDVLTGEFITIIVEDLPLPYALIVLERWLVITYCYLNDPSPKRVLKEPSHAIKCVLRVIHKQFSVLDINHDGTVSNDELKEALGHVLSARIEEMINYVDTNKDGVMSFKEYLQAMMRTALPSEEQSVSSTLHLLDLDHNGTLSDDEIINAVYLIIQRTNVTQVLAELRKTFGNGEKIEKDIPVDDVAKEMLSNPLIRPALNLKALLAREAKTTHSDSHTITMGHKDWVLGTLIMQCVTVEREYSCPVTEAHVEGIVQYSSEVGDDGPDVIPGLPPGKIVLRTYDSDEFGSLRSDFGYASEYYQSLSVSAVFDAMVTGKDMGVLDTVEGVRNTFYFRFLSRDNLFMIRSESPSEAKKFLSVVKDYSVHMKKFNDSYLPKVASIHSLHFLSNKGEPRVIYFFININPLRTLIPIHNIYAIKGITGRVSTNEQNNSTEAHLYEGNLAYELQMEAETRKNLLAQLHIDTEFLLNHGWEYSLMLATTYTPPRVMKDGSKPDGEKKKAKTGILRGISKKKWWCCGSTQFREGNPMSPTRSGSISGSYLPNENVSATMTNDLILDLGAQRENWTDEGHTTSASRGLSSLDYSSFNSKYVDGIKCVHPFSPDREVSIFLYLSSIFTHTDTMPGTMFRQRLLHFVEAHVKQVIPAGTQRRLSNVLNNEEIVFDITYVTEGKKGVLEVDWAQREIVFKLHSGMELKRLPLDEVSVVRSQSLTKKAQCELLIRHNGDNEFDFTCPVALSNMMLAETAYHKLRKITNKLPVVMKGHQATGTFRVLIGSWNVGNKEPLSTNDNNMTWLKYPECDLIIAASQECIKKERWLEWLADSISSEFTLIHHSACWDIHVVAYCRKTSLHRVSFIEAHTEATGIGHVLGNKGGVCITMKVDDSTMAFFGCHLAAHLEKIEQRNSDFSEVLGEISSSLSPTSKDITNAVHHVFWCGDLNYRIEGELERVIQMSDSGRFEELYKMDQLRKEIEKGNVFFGFEDTLPYFPPTYKYKVVHGRPLPKREYDAGLGRIPSWCDRVLYHSICRSEDSLDTATLCHFGCCDEMQTSDHSPVHAVFDVTTRVYHNLPTTVPQAPLPSSLKLCITITKLQLIQQLETGAETSDVTITLASRFSTEHQIKGGGVVNYIPLHLLSKDIVLGDYAYLKLDKFALLRSISIGSCAVPLCQEVFSVPLTNAGLKAGVVEGTITFEMKV